MHRTFVFFPHEFAGIPVFGFGWMLILLAVALAVRIGLGKRYGQSPMDVLASEGLMWGIVAAAIALLMPMVELKNVDGQPVGMAIRGYGVMMLAGVVTAVGLAAYRAKRSGLNPEIILAMAPWAFFGGLLGARMFYVIQYFKNFKADTLLQTIRNMMVFTEGGLVVYGGFIGGFLALTYFIFRNKLPWLRLGDVIVPCMFIGVFFGRIGCLMNGCCYGGRCEEGWVAVHFPAGSAVYNEQLESGELLGMNVDPKTGQIQSIVTDSLADRAGIPVGGKLEKVAADLSTLDQVSRDIPEEEVRLGVFATVDGRRYRWSVDQLPERALPVQAAQLISSATALMLCLALCAVSSFSFPAGTVMMLGFASYAVVRFVLEIVRVDESGQFGTSLSISQWVSILVFCLSLIGLVFVWRGEKPNNGDAADAALPAA